MKILGELQTRMKRLSDFRELTSFFFEELGEIDLDLMVNPKMKIERLADAKISLELALELLQGDIDTRSIEKIKEVFIAAIQKKEMKNGQVLWPVRVALSGEKFSP